MHDPNLQNIPRGGSGWKGELETWVKDIFVAGEGQLFYERDFSAIEAVLVGYFAADPGYIRFAKLGVHDFLCSHMVGSPADLSWSDADLRGYFKSIKATHKGTRDKAKRIVHGSNYLMTARHMRDLYPEDFPTAKDAAALQGLYFELFPAIRKWHRAICEQVDASRRRPEDGGAADGPWSFGVAYARNPFGYVHHFYNVFDWEKVGSEWVATYGQDAKRLVAFLPQSTAAAIIKKAARSLWALEDMKETLRLLIHDSILGEADERLIDQCLLLSQQVMEAPLPELPLPESWGLGPCLTIGTEAKVGKSWGDMH